MAILLHSFISIHKLVISNPVMMNNMAHNHHIIIDEDDAGNAAIFISMSKERYSRYFAPKSSTNYEKELKILVDDGLILRRNRSTKINYYRINTEHDLIKQAYNNNIDIFNIDRSPKMLKPKEGIASLFRSWDIAIFIEILHRYPLLYKTYGKTNSNYFFTAFCNNGHFIVVNTADSFFKKVIPLKVNSGRIIEELSHPDIGFIVEVDKGMLFLNYGNQKLREFLYTTPIVDY